MENEEVHRLSSEGPGQENERSQTNQLREDDQ